MLFNSFSFFLFLLVTLVISAILRRISSRAEIWFLIIASAFFYGQWNWKYLILIYITIITDFLLGYYYLKKGQQKYYLNISLFVNLGILFVFKYTNFLISTGNELSKAMGFDYHLNVFELLLPVGISFYTFQSLSYSIDIKRGQLTPRKNFSDYALFVSFFPQLVAGPIVRASEFFAQLDKKRHFSKSMFESGLLLISIGLVKKVVFADNLALWADPVFNNPEQFSWFETLIGVYAFAFQIYFDFSGYTDIAIGVAKLLGFTFPRNFMHPYISLSIQDFWRRWHMTLSRWLRDYLYISLGGNRNGNFMTMRNLFLTMFLGGLWHGASWNFAIWGVLHGTYLAIERKLSKVQTMTFDKDNIVFKITKWFIIFHLVCFAWIFFRATDFNISMTVINNIVSFKGTTELTTPLMFSYGFICSLPVLHYIGSKIDISQRSDSLSTSQYVSIQVALMMTLFLFSSTTSDSFMYFQF